MSYDRMTLKTLHTRTPYQVTYFPPLMAMFLDQTHQRHVLGLRPLSRLLSAKVRFAHSTERRCIFCICVGMDDRTRTVICTGQHVGVITDCVAVISCQQTGGWR